MGKIPPTPVLRHLSSDHAAVLHDGKWAPALPVLRWPRSSSSPLSLPYLTSPPPPPTGRRPPPLLLRLHHVVVTGRRCSLPPGSTTATGSVATFVDLYVIVCFGPSQFWLTGAHPWLYLFPFFPLQFGPLSTGSRCSGQFFMFCLRPALCRLTPSLPLFSAFQAHACIFAAMYTFDVRFCL